MDGRSVKLNLPLRGIVLAACLVFGLEARAQSEPESSACLAMRVVQSRALAAVEARYLAECMSDDLDSAYEDEPPRLGRHHIEMTAMASRCIPTPDGAWGFALREVDHGTHIQLLDVTFCPTEGECIGGARVMDRQGDRYPLEVLAAADLADDEASELWLVEGEYYSGSATTRREMYARGPAGLEMLYQEDDGPWEFEAGRLHEILDWDGDGRTDATFRPVSLSSTVPFGSSYGGVPLLAHRLPDGEYSYGDEAVQRHLQASCGAVEGALQTDGDWRAAHDILCARLLGADPWPYFQAHWARCETALESGSGYLPSECGTTAALLQLLSMSPDLDTPWLPERPESVPEVAFDADSRGVIHRSK